MDKAQRTAVHKALRTAFDGRVDSRTVGDAIRVTRTQQAKRQRPQWPTDRPRNLQFVLYKENRDTHDALRLLAKHLRLALSIVLCLRKTAPTPCFLCRLPAKAFCIAGTKDRRACTSQLVSIQRVDATVMAGESAMLAGAIVTSNYNACCSGEQGAADGARRHCARGQLLL